MKFNSSSNSDSSFKDEKNTKLESIITNLPVQLRLHPVEEFGQQRSFVEVNKKFIENSSNQRFKSLSESEENAHFLEAVRKGRIEVPEIVHRKKNSKTSSSNQLQKSQTQNKNKSLSQNKQSGFVQNANLPDLITNASAQSVSNYEVFNAVYPNNADYATGLQVKILDPNYTLMQQTFVQRLNDLLQTDMMQGDFPNAVADIKPQMKNSSLAGRDVPKIDPNDLEVNKSTYDETNSKVTVV